MKDEIKEILKTFNNQIKKGISGYELDGNEMRLLLDCITNLQQKYKKLEVLVELMYYKVQLNEEQQQLLDSIIIGGDKDVKD